MCMFSVVAPDLNGMNPIAILSPSETRTAYDSGSWIYGNDSHSETPPETDLVPEPETSLASLDTSGKFLDGSSKDMVLYRARAQEAATAADSPRPFADSYLFFLCT